VTATALAALSATLAYNITIAAGQPLQTWTRLILLNGVYWYVWALFAPVIGWLSIRFPLERRRWMRAIPVHLAAVVAFSTTHIFLVTVSALHAPEARAMPFTSSRTARSSRTSTGR
jgi:MFS family permease